VAEGITWLPRPEQPIAVDANAAKQTHGRPQAGRRAALHRFSRGANGFI